MYNTIGCPVIHLYDVARCRHAGDPNEGERAAVFSHRDLLARPRHNLVLQVERGGEDVPGRHVSQQRRLQRGGVREQRLLVSKR